MIMCHLLDIDFEKICKIIEDCGGKICMDSKYYKGYFEFIKEDMKNEVLQKINQELNPYLIMAILCDVKGKG